MIRFLMSRPFAWPAIVWVALLLMIGLAIADFVLVNWAEIKAEHAQIVLILAGLLFWAALGFIVGAAVFW